MNIKLDTSNMHILECFSTITRVKIIELLSKQPMYISDLAETLELSSTIITKHVQKLEEAGLITTESISGTRGRRKVCHLIHDSITLTLKDVIASPEPNNEYQVSIPVGQYLNYSVKPTCGLASETNLIGMIDDPRYFSNPDHVQAKHIWFASGFVEYRIPNYLVARQEIEQLSIQFEICSEAPNYNENWPSDISFSINGIAIGTWTCPGDYGENKGVYTPDWWHHGTQHGLLKNISISSTGTYLDGIKLSDSGIDQLNIHAKEDIYFKIECLESANYCGGICLFGKGFGNYDQEIEVTLKYTQN